jgi:arginine/lysine/ornithine decarboxylase
MKDETTRKQALEALEEVSNKRIAIEERARDLFNSGLLPLGVTAFESVQEAKRQIDNGLDIRGVVIPANEENPNAQFTRKNMRLTLTSKKVIRENSAKANTQNLLSIEDPAKLLQWARKNLRKENVERDFEGLKIRKSQGKFIATREDGKQFSLKQEGVGGGLRGLVVDKELGAE